MISFLTVGIFLFAQPSSASDVPYEAYQEQINSAGRSPASVGRKKRQPRLTQIRNSKSRRTPFLQKAFTGVDTRHLDPDQNPFRCGHEALDRPELVQIEAELADLTQTQNFLAIQKQKACVNPLQKKSMGCDEFTEMSDEIQGEISARELRRFELLKSQPESSAKKLQALQPIRSLNDTKTAMKTSGYVIPVNECRKNVDLYTPQPLDPIKVVNMHYIFPVRDDEASPGNFTESHDGMGNKSITGQTKADDMTWALNSLMANPEATQWNGSKPIPETIQSRIRFRTHLVSYPKIPIVNGKVHDSFFGKECCDPKREHITSSFRLDSQNALSTPKKTAGMSFGSLHADAQGNPILDSDGNYKPFLIPHIRPTVGNGYANWYVQAPPNASVNENYGGWIGESFRLNWWGDDNQPRGQYPGPFGFTGQRGLYMHEMGHSFGLGHTFQGNYVTVRDPDTGNQLSLSCNDFTTEDDGTWCGKNNNLMDYNCSQSAMSPCQLKVMNYNLSWTQKNLRYLPCSKDNNFTTTIPAGQEAFYTQAHDLIGDLVVEENAVLVLGCGITLAADAQVVIKPGGHILNQQLITRRPACGGAKK